MFQLNKSKNDPLYITVTVHQKPMQMEIDMGAAVSVISESTYQNTWEKGRAPSLQPSNVRLRTFVKVMGVEVQHKGEKKQLPLVVARGQTPSLLGRNWLPN